MSRLRSQREVVYEDSDRRLVAVVLNAMAQIYYSRTLQKCIGGLGFHKEKRSIESTIKD